MDPKIIQELISGVKIELVWALVMSGIAFYILLVIKDFLMTLLDYHKFKSNQYVSIGRLVNVDGFEGRIKRIGLDNIVIEGEEGFYRIVMTRWYMHKWIFLRTQKKDDDAYEGKRLGLRHDDDIKIDRNSPEYQKILKKIQKEKEDKDENSGN